MNQLSNTKFIFNKKRYIGDDIITLKLKTTFSSDEFLSIIVSNIKLISIDIHFCDLCGCMIEDETFRYRKLSLHRHCKDIIIGMISRKVLYCIPLQVAGVIKIISIYGQWHDYDDYVILSLEGSNINLWNVDFDIYKSKSIYNILCDVNKFTLTRDIGKKRSRLICTCCRKSIFERGYIWSDNKLCSNCNDTQIKFRDNLTRKYGYCCTLLVSDIGSLIMRMIIDLYAIVYNKKYYI